MRTAACLGILSACAPTIPAPHPGNDPNAHEIHLVAFADDAYLILERVTGPRASLELLAVRPDARTTTRFGTFDEACSDDVISAVRRSPAAAAIEKLGFSWAEAAGEGDRLETDLGMLLVDGTELRFIVGDFQTRVAELADAEAIERTWYRSADGRWAALSLTYAGVPIARDLRVVRLESAAGTIAALRAFDHHQRGDYATALSWWKDAARLNPRSSRSQYNLACAHARLGHVEDALAHLQRAVDLGGDRFRTLAARDADLDSLRKTARFEEIIRPARPTSKRCP